MVLLPLPPPLPTIDGGDNERLLLSTSLTAVAGAAASVVHTPLSIVSDRSNSSMKHTGRDCIVCRVLMRPHTSQLIN